MSISKTTPTHRIASSKVTPSYSQPATIEKSQPTQMVSDSLSASVPSTFTRLIASPSPKTSCSVGKSGDLIIKGHSRTIQGCTGRVHGGTNPTCHGKHLNFVRSTEMINDVEITILHGGLVYSFLEFINYFRHDRFVGLEGRQHVFSSKRWGTILKCSFFPKVFTLHFVYMSLTSTFTAYYLTSTTLTSAAGPLKIIPLKETKRFSTAILNIYFRSIVKKQQRINNFSSYHFSDRWPLVQKIQMFYTWNGQREKNTLPEKTPRISSTLRKHPQRQPVITISSVASPELFLWQWNPTQASPKSCTAMRDSSPLFPLAWGT